MGRGPLLVGIAGLGRFGRGAGEAGAVGQALGRGGLLRSRAVCGERCADLELVDREPNAGGLYAIDFDVECVAGVGQSLVAQLVRIDLLDIREGALCLESVFTTSRHIVQLGDIKLNIEALLRANESESAIRETGA